MSRYVLVEAGTARLLIAADRVERIWLDQPADGTVLDLGATLGSGGKVAAWVAVDDMRLGVDAILDTLTIAETDFLPLPGLLRSQRDTIDAVVAAVHGKPAFRLSGRVPAG